MSASLLVFTAIDVAVSVTRHDTGSIIVPGNNIQLTYVLTLTNTNEPDWNSDVAAVEPNPTGGDNFQVEPLLGDEDMAAGDDMVFILTGNFDLTDGSLSDGVNGSEPLNLTYTATVSIRAYHGYGCGSGYAHYSDPNMRSGSILKIFFTNSHRKCKAFKHFFFNF